MPSRGQVKVWKPKRSDAWALCDEMHYGRCTCRLNGIGPCSSWLGPLRHCYAHRLNPTEYERARISRAIAKAK